MARTEVRSTQIRDGDVKRPDLNTNETGSAVITKALPGTNITVDSTGIDQGTGDVTINLDPSFLPVSISNGGTGQTTAQTAINALTQTSVANDGKFLKTDGAGDAVWSDLTTVDVLNFAVTTSDATETTLGSIALADNTTLQFRIQISSRLDGITSKSYWATIEGGVRRNNGSAAQLVGIPFQADDGDYSATVDVSGNDLRIRVTGAAAETVKWSAKVDFSLDTQTQNLLVFQGAIPNDEWKTWRNAADSANINVLKVDGSDDTVLNADTGNNIFLSIAGTNHVYLNASGHFQPVLDSTTDLGTNTERFSTLYVDNIVGATIGISTQPNNTFIKWRDQADTKDIDVLGVDTSDDTILKSDTGLAQIPQTVRRINTNTNSIEELVEATTTDATTISLKEVALADDTTYKFRVDIMARLNSTTAKNLWGSIDFGVRRNNASAATLVGQRVIVLDDEGSPTWDFDVDVSGNNVRIRVTGATSETVHWSANIHYIYRS